MLGRERTMSAMPRDLFSVTLYHPQHPFVRLKKKKNCTSSCDFSQPPPSKNGSWDKQLALVSKTQIGCINTTAF